MLFHCKWQFLCVYYILLNSTLLYNVYFIMWRTYDVKKLRDQDKSRDFFPSVVRIQDCTTSERFRVDNKKKQWHCANCVIAREIEPRDFPRNSRMRTKEKNQERKNVGGKLADCHDRATRDCILRRRTNNFLSFSGKNTTIADDRKMFTPAAMTKDNNGI